jgi:hypothetical protein
VQGEVEDAVAVLEDLPCIADALDDGRVIQRRGALGVLDEDGSVQVGLQAPIVWICSSTLPGSAGPWSRTISTTLAPWASSRPGPPLMTPSVSPARRCPPNSATPPSSMTWPAPYCTDRGPLGLNTIHQMVTACPACRPVVVSEKAMPLSVRVSVEAETQTEPLVMGLRCGRDAGI